MAGHHSRERYFFAIEEQPFRRLNGLLYSSWGSDPEKEVPDVLDTLTYLRVRVLNPFLYYRYWV
jgi:hypothetical protein